MPRKGEYANLTPGQKKKLMRDVMESQKRTMTKITVRFHNENDEDVIAYLESVPNKTDFIRNLIREYAAKHPIPEEF